MKSLSAITATFVVVATSAAVGATNNTSAAASSSSSSGSLSQPGSTAPGVAATAGTVTGSLQQVAPKKWGADLYMEQYYGIKDAANGEGMIEGAVFASAIYKPTDKMKIYLRQNLGTNIAASSQGEDKYVFEDTEIGLGLGKIVNWNGGGISLTNRFFLPTGESSRAVGQMFRIREVFVASQELSKTFEVGYIFDPRLHIQSREYNLNDKGEPVETALFKLPQYLTLSAKINDMFSTGIAAGTIESWTKRSGHTKTQSYIDISGSAQLTKEIALTLGIDNTATFAREKHAFFRPSETAYYMNLYASM